MLCMLQATPPLAQKMALMQFIKALQSPWSPHLCYQCQQQVARGVVLISVRAQGEGLEILPQALKAYLSE